MFTIPRFSHAQIRPPSLIDPPDGYSDWLGELKSRIHQAQQRASRVVKQIERELADDDGG